MTWMTCNPINYYYLLAYGIGTIEIIIRDEKILKVFI